MSIPLQPWEPAPPQQAPQPDQSKLFRYQALKTQDTFRLLRLHAGQGDRITCSLHHYVLGSGKWPSYTAMSYTWGKDASRSSIYLPDDSLIKVRKNLNTALRAVRDQESDCWLWIDAICINQDSSVERNHQVRLMAGIYGNANVVLVWLKSSGENADVAKAFKFVHAAATYNHSDHSVYHYIKAHSSSTSRDSRSVQNLCRLRYWTRKWIIQELITARTVVLQVGSSKCSMADLEKFCRQLHQNRDNNAYRNLVDEKPEIWDLIIGSSAGRLALQRSEASSRQPPRLLYELIERYATNECDLPCDHIYALYSLVGDHREHLIIDYDASPLQRLVTVLDFVHKYEGLPSSKVLEFANLLIKLFRINDDDLFEERALLENVDLVVPATLLGGVQIQLESSASIALREMVDTLDPMAVFLLDTSRDTWVLAASDDLGATTEQVACRLEEDDIIWHFPETQLVFVVREFEGHRALIWGRAYLFSAARNHDALDFWLGRPFNYNAVRQGERPISMDLATLLELGVLAVSTNDATMDPKNYVEASVLTKMKRNWFRKVLITGFEAYKPAFVIFAIVLAVIIVQVTTK